MKGIPLKQRREFAAKAAEILAGRRTFTVHTIYKHYQSVDGSLFLRWFNSYVNREIRQRRLRCTSKPLTTTKKYLILSPNSV